MLGEDNVWLHTTSKPYFVSVRGGHDAEHALQKLVSEALKRPLRPPVLDWSQTCPLCFEEPTQSFPLACRHIYCTGCLKHMLISATDGKSIPICCIGDEGRCKTPILPPRHREVHLPRSPYTNVRELVQGPPRTAPQRIQVLPDTGLYPDLPRFEGGLGGYPVSRLFDRDVFTLSQVAPSRIDLRGEHVDRVKERTGAAVGEVGQGSFERQEVPRLWYLHREDRRVQPHSLPLRRTRLLDLRQNVQ
jgi:hypothetical protein